MQVSTHLVECFSNASVGPYYSGKVFYDIGLIGDTARHILEVTYEFSNDTHPDTRLLLEDAAVIFKKLSGEEVSIYGMVEDFQHC